MNSSIFINKTMDRDDLGSPGARVIIAELEELYNALRKKGLKTSSWGGSFGQSGDKNSAEVLNRGYNYKPIEGAADDVNFPWFLYWEIVWIVMNAEFHEGQKVLDLGGSSSLFSYYLASKGMEVTTIDINRGLVENAEKVGKEMGWKLSNFVMNMSDISFNTLFDHITSICVFEHLPAKERIRSSKSIKQLLKPGGRFSITFDYRNPSRFVGINTPEDVLKQLVSPSGLVTRENSKFWDNGNSYLLHPFFHPYVSLRYRIWNIFHGYFNPWEIFRYKKVNDYTFGALFLEKK